MRPPLPTHIVQVWNKVTGDTYVVRHYDPDEYGEEEQEFMMLDVDAFLYGTGTHQHAYLRGRYKHVYPVIVEKAEGLLDRIKSEIPKSFDVKARAQDVQRVFRKLGNEVDAKPEKWLRSKCFGALGVVRPSARPDPESGSESD